MMTLASHPEVFWIYTITMKIPNIPADWLSPPSLKIAAQLQRDWAAQVNLHDDFKKPTIIAGIDVSNNLFDPEQMVYAGVVNLNAETLQPIETASAALKQSFPYRTGFLGFREIPVILEALKQLQQTPDIIFVDGHGISHPRGLGIATHLGVLLDMPTIGVAKSILVGDALAELGPNIGDCVPLIWKDQTIATLLRSKKSCKPLIVSTGHRVSLKSAVDLVMQCLKGYRLPEPTRYAHLAANQCRLNFKS